MIQTLKPVVRPFVLAALVILAAVVLIGGFVLLQNMQDTKVLMTLFAVVWGLGSVALLYFVLNSVAQSLPRRIRSVAVAIVFAGPAIIILFWALVLPTLRSFRLSFMDATGSRFVFLDNYAFAFTEDGKKGYFDEEGKSLQRAFLKSPLRFSRISSRFSNRRFHPVLKRYRPHHGIDYAAPTGTPVHSIGDGTVIKKGYQKRGGGRYVKIRHNSVYRTTYMHFSRFARGIKKGVRVKQGQTIGYVGATGLATGPHLDFRVHKNGSPINPLRMKSPPIAPVKESNKAEFEIVRDSLLGELNRISTVVP